MQIEELTPAKMRRTSGVRQNAKDEMLHNTLFIHHQNKAHTFFSSPVPDVLRSVPSVLPL